MKSNSDTITPSQWHEYLLGIEALTGEIESGMCAIGNNALTTFQESLARQQNICSRLCRLAQQLGIAGPGALPIESSESLFIDRAFCRRIQAALAALESLNRQYGSLLKHVEFSARQLAVLCRSYGGEFPGTDTLNPCRPSWFC